MNSRSASLVRSVHVLPSCRKQHSTGDVIADLSLFLLAEATTSKCAVADECHAFESPVARYNIIQRSFAAHPAKCASPTSPDTHCRSLHSLTTSTLTSADLVCRRLPPMLGELASGDTNAQLGPKCILQIREIRGPRYETTNTMIDMETEPSVVDLSHRCFEIHLSCGSHEEVSAKIQARFTSTVIKEPSLQTPWFD